MLPAPASHSTILVVEDQPDVRRMLCTALQLEGFQVLEGGTAQEGLECLRRRQIHLVVTDYAMPGGTGTWMLNEATREGLLEGIPALIVTATPEIGPQLGPYDVLGKPFDLETFVEQVRKLLRRAAMQRVQKGVPAWGPALTEDCKVELVLYICAFSIASAQARRNLLATLNAYEASQVRLWVHDLTRDPSAGDDDHIAHTPTLVKRWPAPPVWVVGDLSEKSVVEELLSGCGLTRRSGSEGGRFH